VSPLAPSVPGDTMRLGSAIGLVCFASLTFAMLFACVKLLGSGYSPLQVLLMRYGIGLAFSMPFLWRAGPALWQTGEPFAHVVRALYGLASSFSLYFAVTRMPIATVTAISFAMPLFLTVLSVPLLKESVGWRRATAAVVGFCGVLIIVNPGAHLNWVALVALAGAFFYAMAVVSIRQLSRREPANRIYFLYAAANIVVTGVAMPWVWITPPWEDMLIFVLIGILGAAAQYAFLVAYRHAPATVLAPFDYTQILFALAIGYFAWAETPAPQSFIGGAVIIGSGIFIWWRERQLGRRQSSLIGTRGLFSGSGRRGRRNRASP
jgi:drug/metabolite transporter (DMT)-like permease